MLGNEPPLEDRARDQNIERLRDSAAHLIDVVRRLVRIDLGDSHPVDAIGRGIGMLQDWKMAMGVLAAQPPDVYTREVEDVLTRLYERIGAERMWEWLRRPNDRLYDMTPLRRSSHTASASSRASSTRSRLPSRLRATSMWTRHLAPDIAVHPLGGRCRCPAAMA